MEVRVTGRLPLIRPGISLLGGCSLFSGPFTTIDGVDAPSDVDGLVLTSEVALDGINITGFDGKQLIVLGGQNVVKCTSARKMP